MALVVASTSTASANNAATLTITKPTGVAEGDLLLIAIAQPSAGANPTSTGFTICAQKQQNNSGASPDATVTLLYKIATAADVSASNYTIDDNYGASSMGVASMLRVTGWTTGNPVYTSSGTGGIADPVTAATQTGLSLTRPSSSLMLLITGFHSDDSPTSSATFSGYSVTSGESNPTWTEVQDEQVDITTSLANLAIGVAYANSTSTSTVTGCGVTISSDTGGGADAYASLLAIINEPVGASGTNSLLVNQTHNFFSEAGVQVGTTGTNALHSVSPTLNTQSGEGGISTVWTNTNKS